MEETIMEQPYKVLIRVDAAWRVVDINSSAFLAKQARQRSSLLSTTNKIRR